MILARGVGLASFISSGVRGRASGSASAAAWLSSSVMVRIGFFSRTSSRPSGWTRTSCPSRLRILAVIVVMFVLFRLAGRYDANGLSTLRIDHRQEGAASHAGDQIPVFSIDGASRVEILDGEIILEHLGRRLEANPV